MRLFLLSAMVFWGFSCRPPAPHELPALVEEAGGGVQVVILTPAGSTARGQYDPQTREIRIDTVQVPFLPFPGNLGFVPSTRMPYQGDKDFAPVEVLVLGKRLETGDVAAVQPFAAVALEEAGIRSLLVLAVPADPLQRNLQIDGLNDLRIGYPGVATSLEAWLRQYKGGAPARILDWKDRGYAVRFIQASMPEKETER
jgi:inorganic pyrophosphatase